MMYGRGVPLSIGVTDANRHDVDGVAVVLGAIVVQRPASPERISKLGANLRRVSIAADSRWRKQVRIPERACRRASTINRYSVMALL
jgi:hypothetical protein